MQSQRGRIDSANERLARVALELEEVNAKLDVDREQSRGARGRLETAVERLGDLEQHRQLEASNANSNANPGPTPDQALSTLPDERSLVSFNPIVELAWTADDLLYLKTAYVKRMRNEGDSVMSFARWHRLALTAQAAPTPK